MKDPFEEIIGLPHPVSKRHPQMPLAQRAAQFAPFPALSGHEAAIAEKARRHAAGFTPTYDTDEAHPLPTSEADAAY